MDLYLPSTAELGLQLGILSISHKAMLLRSMYELARSTIRDSQNGLGGKKP